MCSVFNPPNVHSRKFYSLYRPEEVFQREVCVERHFEGYSAKSYLALVPNFEAFHTVNVEAVFEHLRSLNKLWRKHELDS